LAYDDNGHTLNDLHIKTTQSKLVAICSSLQRFPSEILLSEKQEHKAPTFLWAFLREFSLVHAARNSERADHASLPISLILRDQHVPASQLEQDQETKGPTRTAAQQGKDYEPALQATARGGLSTGRSENPPDTPRLGSALVRSLAVPLRGGWATK
jgi:hypothetical protein